MINIIDSAKLQRKDETMHSQIDKKTKKRNTMSFGDKTFSYLCTT